MRIRAQRTRSYELQQHWSLPSTNSSPREDNNNTDASFCGKISEDFNFPAGDWNGIEGNFDGEDEQMQSWRRRKRRAIMSFDPLDVSVNDLHLIIQVFRATEQDDATHTLAKQRKKDIGSKIKQSWLRASEKNRSSSESIEDPSTFEEMGAQYLSPVCFGITPVFHKSDTRQKKQERASFFSFPETPELLLPVAV